MIATLAAQTDQAVTYEVLGPDELSRSDSIGSSGSDFRDARRWLAILQHGLQHTPYCVRAVSEGRLVGMLPLAFVKSALFGRFLVSLPYINTAGVIAEDSA